MTFILLLALGIVLYLWRKEKKKFQEELTQQQVLSEQKSKGFQTEITELKTELSKTTSDLTDAKIKGQNLQTELTELGAKYSTLSKYQGLIDIETQSRVIIATANSEAQKITTNAHNELDRINIEISRKKKEAESIVQLAQTDASRIVTEATKKAEETAGEAYKALNEQKEIERTIKAMKNIVEGYGDKYLVPTYSLLDDLAEEFGHTEAGVKLKSARKYTTDLIVQNRAAKCDYVEDIRKTTAINFVLDAFNGKVDTILSLVKKDNYGTLAQKIKDAFQIVNNNGKAFRNAVITNEYLDARLDELKWAVVAQELKWKEQEEQRAIREKIRDEERARREFERAIKEAQKEEDTLKKLLEKAQKDVEQATDAQKAKYEAQLQELEAKLKLAEEKNQRALSMAQQTKSGNVYIISNIGSFGENVYKIGMTRRLEPLDRVRELGDASVPFEFDVHSMIYSEDAPALERELHKKFLRLQMNKVNPRKEFFKITLNEIKTEIEKMNIEVKWTMTAEARQYRESLAIEQEIANDKKKQAEWEKHQLELDPVVELEEDVEA